jgi:hypothetical protein
MLVGPARPSGIEMIPVLAPARPCQMAGNNKARIRSAVGLLQCSWPRMIVPRRVGVEKSATLAALDHLGLTSRFRGGLVSLGPAGGG